MKKILFSLVALSVLSLPVCAEGFIYNNTTVPSGVSNAGLGKVGRAECKNYLGMVQLGDCSYEAAMRNGHISRVNHQDTQIKGWFFYKRIITKVYGQ